MKKFNKTDFKLMLTAAALWSFAVIFFADLMPVNLLR